MPDTVLAPQTTMGPVELVVADLERSLRYYRETIGLAVLEQAAGRARLGVGDRPLLILDEVAGARPVPGSTGLFHFALLVPGRADLAAWLGHAARDRIALTGMSDHAVSEALYLRDPDHHGIEIYRDRERDVWEGRVAELMTTKPLDVDGLLAEPAAREPFAGLADGTVMGHVHLCVADVAATVPFYESVLGFEVMARLGPSAAFFGAGGYHHHVGANTWESAGGRPAPDGAAALRTATVVLPDAAERDAVVARVEAAGVAVSDAEAGPSFADPSGNVLVLAIRRPADRVGP